ncbi:MAG TPA: acyl carrier protein [Byssovorax sp.]
MTRAEILAKLVDLVKEKHPPEALALDASTHVFEGGLGLDSFAAVELIAQIEEACGMQFSDDDFAPEHFTLGNLSEIVEKRRAEAAR